MSRERELLERVLPQLGILESLALSRDDLRAASVELKVEIAALLAEPEGEAQELDAVETLIDREGVDVNLGIGSVAVPAGSRGAVLHKWVEVEISGEDGRPWAFAYYDADEVRPVYRPTSLEPEPEPEYVWRVRYSPTHGERINFLTMSEEMVKEYQRIEGVTIERAKVGPWEVVE
jgi:hypothetical protein